jgi:dimethylaniline monooxygenase (N-oxide forming)
VATITHVTLPTVCVAGAGSSGIAAAKALHQRGFEFDCYGKSDRAGGNWVYQNRHGMSSAYRDRIRFSAGVAHAGKA